MAALFKQKRLIRLEEVDSTNSYLSSKFPGRALPEGSVVWSQNQKKGRGQGANKWASESGKNLTFSIVIYPEFLSPAKQFYISKAICLAVFDLVSLYTDKVSIKWPNDIYVGDKKVAGILIEHTIERHLIKTSIIGIGININQTSFPGSLPNPTSLAKESKHNYDLEELLTNIIDIIEYRYSMLKDGDLDTIDENYTSELYKFKKLSIFETKGKKFAGSIEGVEPTGELIIKNDKSEFLHFGYKEVEYIHS
jgi:BirA family transcriptional regulator, biotin operon repressor / biotin---[acetyl-CoA-carboxylase] ligase